MDINTPILPQILSLFDSTEARGYNLIPFEKKTEEDLICLGNETINYRDTIREIKILYGFNILVEVVNHQIFTEKLNLYYPSNKPVLEKDNDFLSNLIIDAYNTSSSDIHIEVYEEVCRIRFRINGKLLERYTLDKKDYPMLINKIKIKANLDISEKRLPQDGRILYEKNTNKFDLRISVLPTIYGERIVLRLLAKTKKLVDIENLGFSKNQITQYKKVISKMQGLVLISGPTGSGKSTTLYATLKLLNKEYRNILTIEDPIEYTLNGINQVQLKEDIGLSFGSALRAFLRQDPDIIMLGEIRDLDTAQIAIRSSLTGHLLLSTIHTNSAWGSITRLKDMGIHPYLIADTLAACIAQRLIRILCPYCKREQTNNNISLEFLQKKENSRYYTSVGCSKCFYTGFLGRKAIYELIVIDSFLAEAIRNQYDDNQIQNYLLQQNILPLKEYAIELYHKGETTLEEIFPLLQ